MTSMGNEPYTDDELDELFADECAQIRAEDCIEHQLWINYINVSAFREFLSVYVPGIFDTYKKTVEVYAFDNRMNKYVERVSQTYGTVEEFYTAIKNKDLKCAI